MKRSSDQLLIRHDGNPLLSAGDWPYPVNAVFNAGAVRLAGGQTLLLCRVEDRTGASHLCAARSADGLCDWRIDPAPTLAPEPASSPHEAWGVEDPRIVHLPELGQYAVTYTAYSPVGPAAALALTGDFVAFDRRGLALPPENKDAALFPRRFRGRWAMIHRPVTTWCGAHIWLSFSPDLRHWGDPVPILLARGGPWWDGLKVGLSPPPIETDRGWMILYHGVKQTVAGQIYRVGLALLALDDPTRLLRRGHSWVFAPSAPYERVGDVGNVAFPCGSTLSSDGDTIHLYYGAADTGVALARGSLRAMLDWLEVEGRL